MMKVPGHGASLSTMRVIFTSPTLNWFIMTLLSHRQLSLNSGKSPSATRAVCLCGPFAFGRGLDVTELRYRSHTNALTEESRWQKFAAKARRQISTRSFACTTYG